MQSLQKWASDWGDIASISGLVLSLIGFVATLIGVYKSKNAADRAAEAASQMKDRLIRGETISDLAAALAIMDEIKRLHRANAWQLLPDRYAVLRQRLIRIHATEDQLTVIQKEHLEHAVAQFAKAEEKVDLALTQRSAMPNPAKLNQVVSTQIDKIDSILRSVQLQQRV